MKQIIITACLLLTLTACGKEEKNQAKLGDGNAMLPNPGQVAPIDTTATATTPGTVAVPMAADESSEVLTNVIDPSAPNGTAQPQTVTKDTMVSSDFNKKL